MSSFKVKLQSHISRSGPVRYEIRCRHSCSEAAVKLRKTPRIYTPTKKWLPSEGGWQSHIEAVSRSVYTTAFTASELILNTVRQTARHLRKLFQGSGKHNIEIYFLQLEKVKIRHCEGQLKCISGS